MFDGESEKKEKILKNKGEIERLRKRRNSIRNQEKKMQKEPHLVYVRLTINECTEKRFG